MEEEKRIVTIYKDIDYDKPIDQLKETLKKFDATLASINEDEIQIKIAKSKLEDLCNELDLDIDDISEEWDSYVSDQQENEKENEHDELATYVGKIDMQLSDFNANEFIEKARQNKANAAIRLRHNDKAYELYVDFEDEVYVELWSISINKTDDEVNCNTSLIYDTSFDASDMAAWRKLIDKLSAFVDKKKTAAKPSTHIRHHDGFPVHEVMLEEEIDEANDVESLAEVRSTLEALMHDNKISKEAYDRFSAKIEEKINAAHKEEHETKDAYEYDVKLAKQIKDELLEGSNADLPKNIDYAISSRGGKVETMRVAPDSILVNWNLKGFTACNMIYLNDLEVCINRLAEDIAHAMQRTAKDSIDKFHELADLIHSALDEKRLAAIQRSLDFADINPAEKRRLSLMIAHQTNLIRQPGFLKLTSERARKCYSDIVHATELDMLDDIRERFDNDNSITKEEYDILNDAAEKAERIIERYTYDARDKTHAINDKTHNIKDKTHVANIKNADMNEIARICDMLDEANIKYVLSNDTLTVHCGNQQWNQLTNRFNALRG